MPLMDKSQPIETTNVLQEKLILDLDVKPSV